MKIEFMYYKRLISSVIKHFSKLLSRCEKHKLKPTDIQDWDVTHRFTVSTNGCTYALECKITNDTINEKLSLLQELMIGGTLIDTENLLLCRLKLESGKWLCANERLKVEEPKYVPNFNDSYWDTHEEYLCDFLNRRLVKYDKIVHLKLLKNTT